MAGNGNVVNPWDFATALSSQAIRPGDTVWLRGGTYTGDLTCSVNGTAAKRVTFRAVPGQRPIVDGVLVLNGNYVDWIGVEHMNSAYTDRSANTGGVGITMNGAYSRVINCIVHDFSQGFVGGGTVGDNTLVYGCIVYHNGWDSNLGHGFYPQNNGPDPKTFMNNIVFDNFGYGFHFHGGVGNENYMHLIGNTAFNNGSPRGVAQRNIIYDTSNLIENPVLQANMTIQTGEQAFSYVGDLDNPTTNIEMYDNYFAEQVRIHGGGWPDPWPDVTISRLDGNTFVRGLLINGIDASLDYPENIYLSGEPTGGQKVFLRVNDYDPALANVTIFNWGSADTAIIDVTGFAVNGQEILARNVQDYFMDIQELTVAGDGTITVNMQAVNRTVKAPVGWTAPSTTFPSFGCFVLERNA